MATKLKDMQLTSVDLVRAGANQEADICLYKSANPEEAAESPTAAEKNIFKRFLDWLRETPAEAENEPENPVEKADEQPDPADIYKSAIIESLQSIAADENLSVEEKSAMVEKSISQYHDKMVELFKADDSEETGYSFDYLEKSFDNEGTWEEPAEVEKSEPDYDEIEEV